MLWPNLELGVDAPWPDVDLDVGMSWPTLGLGVKKNITPFWIMTFM
jgi:hypothetical protein